MKTANKNQTQHQVQMQSKPIVRPSRVGLSKDQKWLKLDYDSHTTLLHRHLIEAILSNKNKKRSA